MAKLKIILDPGREWNPVGPHVTEVANEADYYCARKHLRAADRDGSELIIWVTAPLLLHWFDDLRSEPLIHIERYDIRQQLATALRVTALPDWLTAELIRDLDLVSKARQAERAADESVLSWTLRILLGPPWGKPQISEREEVLSVLEQLGSRQEWGEVLGDLIVQQLRIWQRDSYGADLWGWLGEAPFERARCLWACWATAGYEPIRTQWLTPEGHTVADTESATDFVALLPPRAVPPSGAISVRIRNFVRQELAFRLQKSGIGGLPSPQSRLDDELWAAVDWLAQRATQGERLTDAEADALSRWADSYRGTTLGEQLVFLSQALRAAPLPAPLSTSATWDQVVGWLEQEYIPAYLNCALCNRLEETEEVVRSFEQWVTKNYHELMMREEGVGLHWFAADLAKKRRDASVILLILDGVPHPLVRWLCDNFMGKDSLHITSASTYLSMLPTITAINQGCLLSARLPDSASPPHTSTVTEALSPIVIRELALPIELLLSMQPGELAVYQWLVVDQNFLHKPMLSLKRWQSAHRAILQLGESLSQFLEEAKKRGLMLWLGVINDHGWTELPAAAQALAVPENLLNNVEHGRILRGIADERYGIPVERDSYFLTESYTISSTYGYYGNRAHGAVHGGATPQEMAVCGWWMTNFELSGPSDLGIEVIGKVKRQLPDNPVRLRLSNYNDETVDVTRINIDRIRFPNLRLPITIGAGGSAELVAVCDASDVRSSTLTITVQLCWHWHGLSKVQDTRMDIPTEGAAETVPDFERMFDR
ncbi:MAG: hypothetical protein ACUVX8_15505 [Candidatus Zipacnadales bacterium]